MVRLGSLLKPRASLPELLEITQDLLDKNAQNNYTFELEVGCVDVIAQLLEKCDEGGVPSGDALTIAAALVKLIWLALGEKMPHPVQRALVDSTIGASLSNIASNTAQAVEKGKFNSQKYLGTLAEIADGLCDLAPLRFKGSGAVGGSQGGPKIKGRTILGPHAVPALTKLVFMKSAPGCEEDALLILRQAAVTALREYLKIPANCALFAATKEIAGGKALPSLFQNCGDFLLQIDLIQILYECAMALGVEEGPSALPKSPFTSQITAIAASTEEVDPAFELRNVLMVYNRKLGKRNGLVASVQALGISLGGNDSVAAPANWVDFGQHYMYLTVKGQYMAANALHISGSQPAETREFAPQLVQVPYRSIAGTKIAFNDDGDAVLSIALHSLPQFLYDEAFSMTHDGTYMQVLSFKASDLVKLEVDFPRVATAMRSAGISLQEDEADLPKSSGGRKSSLGAIKRRRSSISIHSGMSVFQQVQRHNQSARASGNAGAPSTSGGASPGSTYQTGDDNKGRQREEEEDSDGGKGEHEAAVDQNALKTGPKNTGKTRKSAKADISAKPKPAAVVGRRRLGGGKKKTTKNEKLATQHAEPDAGKDDTEQEYQAQAQGEGEGDDGLLDWMTEAAPKLTPEGLRPTTQPGAYFYDSSDDDDFLGLVPHVPKPQYATAAALAFPGPGEQRAPEHPAPSSIYAHDSLNASSDDSEGDQDPPPAEKQTVFGDKPSTGAAFKRKPAAGRAPAAAAKPKSALKKTAPPKPKAPKASATTKAAATTKSKPPPKTKTKTTAAKKATKAPPKPKAPAAKATAAKATAPAVQEDLRADSDKEWEEDGDDVYGDQLDYLPLTQKFPSSAPLSSPEDLSPAFKNGQQHHQMKQQMQQQMPKKAASPAPVAKRTAGAELKGLKGLKDILVAASGEKNNGGDEGATAYRNAEKGEQGKNANIARGPTPPSSKTAKGQGRLAAMRGKNPASLPRLGRLSQGSDGPETNPLKSTAAASLPASTGAQPDGSDKKKAALIKGVRGAHLLTITPAITAAKKRDAGSDPPAAAAAAAAAGGAGGARGKRVAAATAAAKVRLGLHLEASSEDGSDEDIQEILPAAPPAAAKVNATQRGQRAGGKQRLDRIARDQQHQQLKLKLNAAPEKNKKAAALGERAPLSVGAIPWAAAQPGKTKTQTASKPAAAKEDPFDMLPDNDFMVHIDSESDDDDDNEGGGGLFGGGNTAALLAMLTGGGGARKNGRRTQHDSDESDTDDDDDDGVNTEQFSMAIAQMMATKKRKAAKKKDAASKKLQNRLSTLLKAAETAIHKEYRDAHETVTRVHSEVCAQLENKKEDIMALHEQYEAVITEKWDEYNELEAAGEAKMQVAQREADAARRAGKRKLEEITDQIQRELSEGQKRIKLAAKRADRGPDIPAILQMLAMSG